MASRRIEVRGPDRQSEFVATLPNGEQRTVWSWQDVEMLMLEWGVEEVHGDLRNLQRRDRPA
jgi:hypothetical protein